LDNALSATSMLRKRYVSTPFDIFGLGCELASTRFGSFVQRVSAAYTKYAPNGKSGDAIKQWDFEAFKMADRPASEYFENKDEIVLDLIPWVEIKAICFAWAVDKRGNLKVTKVFGYVSFFYLSNKNYLFFKFLLATWKYELHDFSEIRLGHPLKLLRALSHLHPKAHYPWPSGGDSLAVEKSAVLMLLGCVPFPGRPPFQDLASDLYITVGF
jgi:hypothetical protein